MTEQAGWSHTPGDPPIMEWGAFWAWPLGEGPPLEVIIQPSWFTPSDLLSVATTDTFYVPSSRPKGQS